MCIRCKCDRRCVYMCVRRVLMWYSVMWLVLNLRVPYWISWLFFFFGRGISHWNFRLHFVVFWSTVAVFHIFCFFIFFVHFGYKPYAKMADRDFFFGLLLCIECFARFKTQIDAHAVHPFQKATILQIAGSINLCITILGTNRYYSIIYCLLRCLRSSDATICLL